MTLGHVCCTILLSPVSFYSPVSPAPPRYPRLSSVKYVAPAFAGLRLPTICNIWPVQLLPSPHGIQWNTVLLFWLGGMHVGAVPPPASTTRILLSWYSAPTSTFLYVCLHLSKLPTHSPVRLAIWNYSRWNGPSSPVQIPLCTYGPPPPRVPSSESVSVTSVSQTFQPESYHQHSLLGFLFFQFPIIGMPEVLCIVGYLSLVGTPNLSHGANLRCRRVAP
jgi:hypothetical protein